MLKECDREDSKPERPVLPGRTDLMPLENRRLDAGAERVYPIAPANANRPLIDRQAVAPEPCAARSATIRALGRTFMVICIAPAIAPISTAPFQAHS